jgi:tetratricopeptide (TPR) repeat protein
MGPGEYGGARPASNFRTFHGAKLVARREALAPPSEAVRAGHILADRFEIGSQAGSGGMGVVYRAIDRLTGVTVAVKVLQKPDTERAERFRREVRALSQLAHPAIVHFVDSGLTPENEPYLAMEWLEGEDLAKRFGREGVGAVGALALAHRMLSALVYAHERGVVHRDIKPSNIFLVGDDPEQAKLLDFGIAWLDTSTQLLTGTGAMLGSIGYMAPEQARGERLIGPRSDLFSLGCVLFEAFAGRPTFIGDHPVTVLLQAMNDRPPRLGDLRPDLPEALCDLVDRLLARAPEERPASAAEALDALREVGSLGGVAPAPRRSNRPMMSGNERRMVSVILVRGVGAPILTTLPNDMPTIAVNEDNRTPAALRSVVEGLGGHVMPLRHNANLVLLEGRGAAHDEAAQAASCALAIHAALPDAQIAIATGPAEMSGRWAAGPVVDRALQLLDATRVREPGADTDIRMDEVTADLLDARFSVHAAGTMRILSGAQALAGESRKVLGKPTPCVGRDRELAFLESTFATAADEREARAVMVLAPAGIGKSRLRREIVARVQRSGTRVISARCDALYAGSPNHAVAELVRLSADIHEDQAADVRRERLVAYVGSVFPEGMRPRARDFLGELLRAPDGQPSPLVRAARNDPRVMAEQVREVFEAWLRALTEEGPLLVVLEDVHWSDASSARLFESALEALADRPLCLLALARPEVRDARPRPFATFSELPLDPLTKRAAEKLVRAILGAGAAAGTVERVVTRAAGNAFYLEELVRHVAQHGEESLPETVLAMVRSRLDALEPEARRVLRVGSVFGECLWESGVMALLGGTRSLQSIREWLETLVAREVLEPGDRGRFAGERDYVFRHALLRDAAYATLTEQDRKVGHRLAGGWLEEVGERDPQVLAEHFLRAAEPERAAPYLLRAAEARMGGGDLDGAASTAEKGVACKPTGELRGRLLLMSAMARGFRSDFERATGAAKEAIDLLSPGSVPWFQCAGVLVLAGAAAGSPGAMFELMGRLSRLESPPEPSQPYAFTVFMLVTALVQLGQRDMALGMGARLEGIEEGRSDPAFEGFRDLVRATLADKAKVDRLDEVLARSDAAWSALRSCGDRLGEAIAGGWRGRALELAGALEEALAVGREALELTERTDNAMTRKRALCVVGAALVGLERHEEAAQVLGRVPSDDLMAHLLARVNLARSALYRGDFEGAAREAQATADAAGFFGPHKASALGVLAAARNALGDHAGALSAAREGRTLAENGGADVWTLTLLRLGEIEALRGTGAAEEARRRTEEAAERLRTIAKSLQDERLAASFLAVRECARTIALAAREPAMA